MNSNKHYHFIQVTHPMGFYTQEKVLVVKLKNKEKLLDFIADVNINNKLNYQVEYIQSYDRCESIYKQLSFKKFREYFNYK